MSFRSDDASLDALITENGLIPLHEAIAALATPCLEGATCETAVQLGDFSRCWMQMQCG